MTSVRSFHRYRGENSFSLPRLIAILKELIPEVAPSQTRYRVTEIPTERTIRFYTAQGLVDRPAARSGGVSLYGYRHLLQILAIKYLQSQYLPLVKVRSLVARADNRELEMMIPSIAPVTATHRGIAREDRALPGPAFHFPSTALPPRPHAERPQPALASRERAQHDTWHRIEVGPGIELHVLEAALSGEQREQLRGALLREIGTLRGWRDGGGKS